MRRQSLQGESTEPTASRYWCEGACWLRFIAGFPVTRISPFTCFPVTRTSPFSSFPVTHITPFNSFLVIRTSPLPGFLVCSHITLQWQDPLRQPPLTSVCSNNLIAPVAIVASTHITIHASQAVPSTSLGRRARCYTASLLAI